MQSVLVVDARRQPHPPCHPAQARILLRSGRARILRHHPFTIVLTEPATEPTPPSLVLKIDPGSRTTGMVLVAPYGNNWRVIWAAEIHHRGLQVKKGLDQRRGVRRSRRWRKTRYRAARYRNRRRREGWLPPSLESRVANVLAWVGRLLRFAPVGRIEVETVRFDTQLIVNPEISGVEYQRGELADWELREYLLQKWERRCAYCGATEVPLQKDHIHPRSRGGSDRASNFTLACERCNQAKGAQDIRVFLADDPERLAYILRHAQQPLRDAAAVNSTRLALLERLQRLGVPVQAWSGGRTKHNRVHHDYPKAHWIDAACVGEQGWWVLLNPNQKPLSITAMGHGSRQMCLVNRYGFPRTRAKRRGKIHGFQTGDLALGVVLTGKQHGRHRGRVVVRATGYFRVGSADGVPARTCRLLQFSDGYSYR